MYADFDAGAFQKALQTQTIGRQIIYRTTVPSTMELAFSEVRLIAECSSASFFNGN